MVDTVRETIRETLRPSTIRETLYQVPGAAGPDGVMLDADDNFMVFADGDNAAFAE